jgi:tetratricopeptide (TPR) repeat protein
MPRGARLFAFSAIALALAVVGRMAAQREAAEASLTIDYPLSGSVFPPEITEPTFLWRDSSPADAWEIEVAAGEGAALRYRSNGAPPALGEIDSRAVGKTNALPQPLAAHSWKPDAAAWSEIKRRSTERDAAVVIRGLAGGREVSRAQTAIRTSQDPVGAPIFYRDVPLMPSEAEKGVIKPLATAAIPLIAWRLREIGQPASRVVLQGLHTCTNCHSFSRDGKTLGMDVDGPENDKGTYAIAPVSPRMTIRNEDVITWNDFRAKPAGQRTIGFLSQMSPDGQYAVTTLNEELYTANFTDYRFLQVFYPTRGILAWYSRADKRMEALPGADYPRYVHTDAVWTPDGKYLIFARAEARDAYPAGRKMAEFAGDPNEVPIQYDLYRIPFNGGKGGRPEPIRGASNNGMSNTFPKVSPDGRWIVFVECRNGQLMRPDGQLYILPVEGGEARRMRANTALMNSWHSFSPNGKWLVFSSKSRSPYTQMFLTHLNEDGVDSPPVLIENSTAANRAVNLPEFVNIPKDGLLNIDVPAAEFYRLFDSALEMERGGRHAEAVAEWRNALRVDPENAKAHTNLGIALWHKGEAEPALAEFRKAVVLNARSTEAHNNLGVALVQLGRFADAIPHFRIVLEANPASGETRQNLGVALLESGQLEAAGQELRRVLEANPNSAEAHDAYGRLLARQGKIPEAVQHWRKALEVKPDLADARFNLGDALFRQGKPVEALAEWRQGLRADPENAPVMNQAAWTLATSPNAAARNGAEAVRLAERVLRLSNAGEPAVFDTLAAAYAEAGRYREAAETARKGAALADARKQQRLAGEMRTRAALYEENKPFREPPRP